MSNDRKVRTNKDGSPVNVLSQANRIKLISHLAQNITTYTDATPAKVAELASEAIGSKVTLWNVSGVAEHIGLRLNYDQKTRSVISSKVDLFAKVQALEVKTDKTEKAIAYLAEQLKAISEDLAALESKVGAGILS